MLPWVVVYHLVIAFKYIKRLLFSDFPPWLLLSCSRYIHDLRKVQRSTLTCHVGEGASATPYWRVLIPGDCCKCKIFISCFSILLFTFLSTLSVSYSTTSAVPSPGLLLCHFLISLNLVSQTLLPWQQMVLLGRVCVLVCKSVSACRGQWQGLRIEYFPSWGRINYVSLFLAILVASPTDGWSVSAVVLLLLLDGLRWSLVCFLSVNRSHCERWTFVYLLLIR